MILLNIQKELRISQCKNIDSIIPNLLQHSDDIILVDGHSNDGTTKKYR